MKSPESRPPQVEREKSPEEQKRQAYFGAVFQWMDKLTSDRPPEVEKKLSKLPRSRQLGAAFVPTALFSALVGCTNFDIVECTQDESDYLTAMQNWIVNHSDEIQAEMDIMWPNAQITGSELSRAVATAQIECGVQVSGMDEFGGEALDNSTMVIDVNDASFRQGLELYKEYKWVGDFSMDELVQIHEEGTDEVSSLDLRYYNEAIYLNADIVAHETAHFLLGSHATGDQKQAESIVREQGRLDEMYEVDEIYAWGGAARYAAVDWTDEMIDEIYR
ncbi:MAG: hypothetical protein ABIA47_02065 [bacterium]